MSAIDFVITWVDGDDPAWQREKARYSPAKDADARPERYRDWGLLPYWFRGVEKFAPWAGKIYFVTWGHLPGWLNTEHPKLRVVNHRDYIPEEYLPTFNSRVIEMHLHRIETLSENFVYFNDDMLLTAPTAPEDYFIDGKPCDLLAFQPVVANPANPSMSHEFLNISLMLSKYFDKRQNVRRHPGNYFHIGYPPLYFFYNLLELAFPLYTGFYTPHGPFPFCKSAFETIWQKEGDYLGEFSAHRFRSNEDVGPYLVREWQKLSGEFHPKNVLRDLRYFNVSDDNQKLCRTIEKQKAKCVCINDANHAIDFAAAKEQIRRSFEKILPEKSAFER